VRVLAVDDDPDFLGFLRIALEEAGIELVPAGDAQQAVELLEVSGSHRFDLVLLDIEMPGPSGLDLMTRVRESGDEVPVIFVSGIERTEQRVRALRLGADDYMVKPIEFEELLARIEAVLRRRRALPTIEFGDLTLDLARRKATRAGKPVYLSPKEFDLLLVLVQAGGKTISRQELLRLVWDMDFDPRTNLLDVHIGRVRKKIDRFGRPVIQTVRGEGYRAQRRDPESA